MALTSGSRFGSFEILSPLGAGGMGEVYRARDTKLRRDVALKILPELFASNPDRLARFTREAQTLAALNHPNIAHIHGLEESGGVRALVMELVEGEDLSKRIKRGAIPLDEALPLAKQVAEALEAAHEQGIIHRDLKPANIQVRPDGMVKVLDFGLAKLTQREAAAGHTDVRESPTITAPAMLTGAGVILGTAAYMSPEQAKGRPADKRSDLWAFGCVLFEMLTGKRAFDGADVPETLANVLTLEPHWDRLPPTTPAAVHLLLRRCLRKDRRQRLQDAAGVRIEIEDVLSAPAGSASVVSPGGRAMRQRSAVVTGVAFVGGAVIAGFAVWQLQASQVLLPRPVTRLTVTMPADQELVVVQYPAIAVSPNGAHLVYVAKRRGVQQLYVRSIDSLESKALQGTEGGLAPFFSPDSHWVGFFAEGQLKKIRVTGGASQVLCDSPDSLGGSWAPNDIIYFSQGNFSGLWQVSATGGAARPFTKLQGEISHRWPQVLPGGQAVLFTSSTGPGAYERQVQVQSVSSGERHVLAQGDSGHYGPSGHLVYAQPLTGTLVAVVLDLAHLQTEATRPVAIAAGLLPALEGVHFALSDNGVLAYLAGPADRGDRRLVWVDRHGNPEPLKAPGRRYEYPAISPDGQQVAFMTWGAKSDVWLHNLARGTATKLMSDGSNQYPIWTPDGKRLTYRATRASTRNVFWRMADGSGTEERLTTGEGAHAPNSWSPDGQILLFSDGTSGGDIASLRLTDHKTQPFVRTRFNEVSARFSPDGRWVAYVSDESGRAEVYVQPYPGPGGKWQISTDGGTEAVWNPNGRELFYRSDNKMMAVNITSQPAFMAGRPSLLFAGDFAPSGFYGPNYDVSRDGRFLMVQPSEREDATPTQLIVVLNWFEELKRPVPATK